MSSKALTGIAVAMGLAACLFVAACGDDDSDSSSSSSTTTTETSSTTETTAGVTLLPRNVIIALDAITPHFSEITAEAETGENSTSSGQPVANRMVIYANADQSKKVTVSVDQYASDADATAAFDDAAARSKEVEGFSPLPAPDIGDKASAGTVTQGDETHVGVAVLKGDRIVQATAAGFSATPADIRKIEAVAAAQADALQ